MPQFNLSLYLVTDQSLSLDRPLKSVVESAVRGGVSMVQLREKNCTTKEFYDLAMRIKACLKPYNVPLIINDRLDIALACGADGLHIGQNDLPSDVIRKIMGKDKIIGLTVESVMDAEKANNQSIDYIGISPVFETPTKSDTVTKALGLSAVKEIARISKHRCVAIGGINSTNAREVIEAGAEGISVVSAIMSAENPQDAARQLRSIVDNTKNRMG